MNFLLHVGNDNVIGDSPVHTSMFGQDLYTSNVTSSL